MVHLKPVSLLWVVHFHQPLGNFQEVIDRYVQRSLRPFISHLHGHPSLKLTVHVSGVLLSHLKQHGRDVLESMAALVQRGQVEMLGGGFYEPIFSMIPLSDIEPQLQMMSDWLESEFETTPQGVWLPESVWEPHFASILHKAGFAYTVLDESIFGAAGWRRAQLFHPFRTQYLNDSLTVFPSQRQWSKQIPLQNLRDIKASFHQLAHRQEEQMIVLAQHGDQYGIWPETHHLLYQEGMMEEWCQYLETQRSWITPRLLRESHQGHWPLAFLPSGSVSDLESYSLAPLAQRAFLEARTDLSKRFDADRFTSFFRGGTWLNFLAKYPEAHLMQNKLVWLHNQVQDLPRGRVREEAEGMLLAAEEHSAYWHSETGGVYANYLRDTVYSHLIAAEKVLIAEELDSRPPLIQTDYNGDGGDEILLRTENCGLVAVPNYGGSLCELNFWPTTYNLANTFRRRQEAHFPSEPPSIRTVEDWHERRMFQEHFTPPQTHLAQFQSGTFVEHGDFIDQQYEIVQAQYTPETCSVTLEREGGLYFSGTRRPLTCRKRYRLTAPGNLTVNYTITNSGLLPTDCLFICEINYTLLDGRSSDRRLLFGEEIIPVGASFERKGATDWMLEDLLRDFRWSWKLTTPADLWHFPIETPALVGDTWEMNYQGSALLLSWPLQLPPGQSVSFEILGALSSVQ